MHPCRKSGVKIPTKNYFWIQDQYLYNNDPPQKPYI